MILFITRAWPTGGGTEIWLDTLYGALRRANLDVRIAVATGGRFNLSGPFFASNRYIKEGLVIDGRTGSRRECQWQVARLLRRVKPHVVVPLRVHDALAVACGLKAELGYRLVYALHEYRAGLFAEMRQVAGWLDRVVVCDELSRRVSLDLCDFPPDRVITIPQGVDIGSTMSPRPPDSVLRIGYAGRLEQTQKQVRSLPDLCIALESRGVDYRLRIAGTGPEEAWLREQLAAQVARGTVTFDGLLAPEALRRDFYPALDALILLSTWETGPIVAWEAMADGAILVTARYRGLTAADFLRHDENCLVFEQGDIDRAADLLIDVSRNTALRKRLRAQAADDIRKTRSIDSVAHRWGELLSQVCQQPPCQSSGRPAGLATAAGRLEQLGLPATVTWGLKRALGYRFMHASPGEEWPFHAVPSPHLADAMERSLITLDTRLFTTTPWNRLG